MIDQADQPLRLATGSHQAGTGKGCAMNIISWENGDTTITDIPVCVDLFLAYVVQSINDSCCSHRTGDLLCSSCSIKVLDLAHRTVGTAGVAKPVDHVRLAIFAARSVAYLNPDPRVEEALAAVEHIVEVLQSKAHPRAVAHAVAAAAAHDAAARAAAHDAAHDAAHAAATAAAAAARAAAAAAHAAACAAAAAAARAVAAAHDAARAAAAAAARAVAAADDAAAIEWGHLIIDQWFTTTGHTSTPTLTPETTATAIENMLAVSNK